MTNQEFFTLSKANEIVLLEREANGEIRGSHHSDTTPNCTVTPP